MRIARMVPEAISHLDGPGRTNWQVAPVRFSLWNRTRTGLRLLCAIVLLGLLLPRNVPETRPTRHARGTAGVPIRVLAFAPDGQTIATVDDLCCIKLRPVVVGADIERTINVRGSGKALAFSPDGRFLAVGREEPDIVLHRLDDVGAGRFLGMPIRHASHVSFSPDGRMLAVSSFCSREILVWDLDAASVRMTLRGHTTPVHVLAYASDGRSLASAANGERSILLWDLANGSPPRRLTGLAAHSLCLAFSPDSRLLASACCAETAVRIWDLAAARQVVLIRGRAFPTRSLSFSPDGRLLATASGDGGASLWSVATGREVRRLDTRADILWNIAFSPDGKTLAAAGDDDDVRLWDVATLIDDPSRDD